MDPFLNLANRLYEVVLSNISCLTNWGFYLFDKDFDKEPELRNRIGTIWICSLFDTLEAEQRFLPEIETEARRNNWPTLAHAAQELTKFCVIVGELLDLFSREEQIFLQDHRNQLVHSYLAARHRSIINAKHFRHGKLIVEHLPAEEYHALIRVFIENKTVDQVLAPLVARIIASQKSHRYWIAAAVMQKDSTEVYRILREGEIFTITI